MTAEVNPYRSGLDKCAANYESLTPITFLERSAYVYPDRIALIHGQRRYTWAETYARARRLASVLKQHGIDAGDTVAVMLNNTPEMFECHFGVPMTGAVLNTMNTRLDAETIAFMLNHGEAKVLIADREYSADGEEGAGETGRPRHPRHRRRRPGIHRSGRAAGQRRIRVAASPTATPTSPGADRRTSGMRSPSTTPRAPPAIRRGSSITIAAPISTRLSNIVCWGMPPHAVYLWTLPMFHCNGWCFPWTMAANCRHQRLPAPRRCRS